MVSVSQLAGYRFIRGAHFGTAPGRTCTSFNAAPDVVEHTPIV